MRPETSEALARLVSIYVALIERTGIDINDANINRIMTDPFAACESLNELAVKVGALDAEADAAIAAIYESMDAADARSAADEACLTMAAAAWETTHVERPVPEPEPEPESQAADEPKDAEAPDEAEDKPKRRRRSKSKKAERKDMDAQTEKDAPGKKRRAKKDEAAPADEQSADAPVVADKPAEAVAPETSAKTETPAAAKAESLSVDQAVAILGVSRPTVYKLIESGELPAYKKGRSWRISAEAVSKRAAN
ncbi:helix-turn-helix domain-containing protein [uncultured Parolsenella sp.]|uniref:helix-turn-helix domain-containing protein n=1 Tax=uncultured Parolsenella sp. TaxID=2083008 RepID=UPI0025E3350B|nr:helix-turn-helix domain-containing protein [uncultured Parolsenella sp.]